MNQFFERRYYISGIFMLLTWIILCRLFFIQVLDDRYVYYANNNVLRTVVSYPARGVIVDRNGKLLNDNRPVFDIMVIPKLVKSMDTLALCRLLNISQTEFKSHLEKAKAYSLTSASIFAKQLSIAEYASLEERIYEFPGFFTQVHYSRTYPDSVAAHFLGFVGEVNDREIEQSHGYYRPGDYIGISGIEKVYDTLLRGRRGVQKLMINARNIIQGSYAMGRYDTVAVPGKRLMSSLDIRIQKLGETLMHDKVGSIVAIEPSTGEILCYVSSPGYDPNLLVGQGRGGNVADLYHNPNSPFLNRPIQAYYPPGSSFKPLDALIALQEGIIKPATAFFCPDYYQAGNRRVKDEHFNGWTDLKKAIAMSSNTYFCIVFDKLMNKNGTREIRRTYDDWREQLKQFGLGQQLSIDLPHEKTGHLPSSADYDQQFGKNKWRSSNIISLAIGQGELLVTPLQMANMECMIANRGFYFPPHAVKAIGDEVLQARMLSQKVDSKIDPQYFEPVIDGMEQVVEHGTASASRVPGIRMCGKTGTVQNPHGKNHSVFVAFAPREHPKIAIAVVVENAGYGATWAAPIGSYLVEKYLKGFTTSRPSGLTPEKIQQQNLLPTANN